MSNIHPTAIIDPSARIDPSVQIGPYTIIGPETIIGPGCIIGPHVVMEYAQLGRENKVLAGAYVGTPPQDLKYAGEKTRLVIGDRNVVREGVTLHRGTKITGETRIGSGCLFMALSHVAHDCRIGNGVIMANAVGMAGHVEVGDNAVISGLCGIHQFVRIGRLSMLGGGSMVSKDILPFCMAQGDRATLRGLNSLGLRRAGFAPATIRAIKNAYATLFTPGLRLEETVSRLKDSQPCPEVAEVLEFIAQAKRGITRPASGQNEGEGTPD